MEKKLRTPFAAILLTISVILSILKITPLSMRLLGFKGTAHILTVLPIVIDALLCCCLWLKKRNIIVVLAMAGKLILPIVQTKHNWGHLMPIFKLSYIPILLAHILLFIFVFVLCEPSILKMDLSKLKRIIKNAYFVPALLLLINSIDCFVRILNDTSGSMSYVFTFVNSFLNSYIAFYLIKWMSAPKLKSDVNPVKLIKKMGAKQWAIIAAIVIAIILLIGSCDDESGGYRCNNCGGDGWDSINKAKCVWCGGDGVTSWNP